MANSNAFYSRLPSEEDAQINDPPPYTPHVSTHTSESIPLTNSSTRIPVRVERMQLLPPAAPPPPYSAMVLSTSPAPALGDHPPDPQALPDIDRGASLAGDTNPSEQTPIVVNEGHITQTTGPQVNVGMRSGDTELILLSERRSPEIVQGEQLQAPDTNSLFCLSAFALLLCWPFGTLALLLTLVARAKIARPNASEAVRLQAIKLYMLAYRMAICGIMFGFVNLILLFTIDPSRLEQKRRELVFKSG
jgi:hypothetical protein